MIKEDTINPNPSKALIYKLDFETTKPELNVIFSTNTSYPELKNGFNHHYHKIQSSLIDATAEFKDRKKIYLVTSEFEPVIDELEGVASTSIKDGTEKFMTDYLGKKEDYTILSKSFFKLWEILIYFDLIHSDEKFTSTHLCENTGSNLQAIILFREILSKITKNDSLTKKDKYCVEENKNKIMNDKIKEEFEKLEKDNFKKISFLKSNFDDDLENVDLVTVDISFNSENEILFEQMALGLILNSILSIIKIQKLNGNSVIKFYETWTTNSLKLLSFLKYIYKTVYICKPLTSRKNSCEKFVVCKGFIKSHVTPKFINEFNSLMTTIEKNKDYYIVSLFNNYPINNDEFVFYRKMNIETGLSIYKSINTIMQFINLDNFNGIEYREFLNKQILASFYWISVFLNVSDWNKHKFVDFTGPDPDPDADSKLEKTSKPSKKTMKGGKHQNKKMSFNEEFSIIEIENNKYMEKLHNIVDGDILLSDIPSIISDD